MNFNWKQQFKLRNKLLVMLKFFTHFIGYRFHTVTYDHIHILIYQDHLKEI